MRCQGQVAEDDNARAAQRMRQRWRDDQHAAVSSARRGRGRDQRGGVHQRTATVAAFAFHHQAPAGLHAAHVGQHAECRATHIAGQRCAGQRQRLAARVDRGLAHGGREQRKVLPRKRQVSGLARDGKFAARALRHRIDVEQLHVVGLDQQRVAAGGDTGVFAVQADGARGVVAAVRQDVEVGPLGGFGGVETGAGVALGVAHLERVVHPVPVHRIRTERREPASQCIGRGRVGRLHERRDRTERAFPRHARAALRVVGLHGGEHAGVPTVGGTAGHKLRAHQQQRVADLQLCRCARQPGLAVAIARCAALVGQGAHRVPPWPGFQRFCGLEGLRLFVGAGHAGHLHADGQAQRFGHAGDEVARFRRQRGWRGGRRVECKGQQRLGCHAGAQAVADELAHLLQRDALGGSAQIAFVGDAFLVERQHIGSTSEGVDQADAEVGVVARAQLGQRRELRR